MKALKTVLDNNEMHTVRNRFIDWKTLNSARTVYEKLLTATEQYRLSFSAQLRGVGKCDKLQHNATIYISHFLQVLMMSVERGEIKKGNLKLYGLAEGTKALPKMRSVRSLVERGEKTIAGEKTRIKQGGRPIYNPTIGMVGTHLDIFKEAHAQQKRLQERTNRALENLKTLRPEVDAVVLELWNQIEANFKNEPQETRFDECRKYGVVYYYRRGEAASPPTPEQTDGKRETASPPSPPRKGGE